MALPIDEEISLASEERRSRWMHRRLLIFCFVSMAAAGIEVAVQLVMLLWKAGSSFDHLFTDYRLLPGAVTVLVFFFGYRRAKGRQLDRAAVIRYSFWLIVAAGALAFLVEPLFVAFPIRTLVTDLPPEQVHSQPSRYARLLATHLVGALFIPWTVREAARVLAALCGLALLSNLLFVQGALAFRIVEAFLLPTAGVPGLLYCWFRYSRFRRKFTLEHVLGRYGQLQQELQQARSIHEMLFPGEITDGPCRFRYCYEPMQQLGGDFVYARRDEADRLSVVVLDVTGHGITAALTVNRIGGELDRLFGEQAARLPGEVLTALNRYFCVSIARHGIYATAVAVRHDPQSGQLEWANAGHPPPFVLKARGGCTALDSNAVMLGVLDEPLYECQTQSLPFADGDRIFVYTDGATEAHNSRDEMLGIEGFQRVLLDKTTRKECDSVSQDVLREVQRFRSGPPEDDILIVELTHSAAHMGRTCGTAAEWEAGG
jgi:hypothetical protein